MDTITDMGFTLRVDKRKLTSAIDRLEELNGVTIEAGYFEGDRYGPENHNLPVATVAAYNNSGTIFNPQRPFMDDAFEQREYQRVMVNDLKKAFGAALTNGRSTNRFVREASDNIVKCIRASLLEYAYAGGNSKATIERKGFDMPLIDTGKMLDSIKSKIHKGRS